MEKFSYALEFYYRKIFDLKNVILSYAQPLIQILETVDSIRGKCYSEFNIFVIFVLII